MYLESVCVCPLCQHARAGPALRVWSCVVAFVGLSVGLSVALSDIIILHNDGAIYHRCGLDPLGQSGAVPQNLAHREDDAVLVGRGAREVLVFRRRRLNIVLFW